MVQATEFAQAKGGEAKVRRLFKGEGRGGSLGIPVGSNGTDVAAAQEKVIPPPLKANTKETVRAMFENGYFKYTPTPFWTGKSWWNLTHGTHVLWKNVPTGRNGGESTKAEVFHGECHGWASNEEVYLS